MYRKTQVPGTGLFQNFIFPIRLYEPRRLVHGIADLLLCMFTGDEESQACIPFRDMRAHYGMHINSIFKQPVRQLDRARRVSRNNRCAFRRW
uniref:Uncharacterized protein n=1 Tax=Candidatus Kentrum sp. TUN TaxID=2126343 RepID=A0A451A5M1_9GAMM|nr:MAG: hypothetical protein BECKTUN1418F_GA0071002_12533 [Candidatus Kentron sp. TUN]